MDAAIKLVVTQKDGRSYIRSLYTTPPFRVVSVGQLASDGGAYLMQMSTSPGVLSGDNYQIDITLEESAELQFKSQSYQRIFDMEGEAKQHMRIIIGDGAHFSQVPHPIVPHRNSSYIASTHVKLGHESSFLQSEIITCGRRLHGEEFRFRKFSNSVEIYSNEVLRLKDRVYLAPSQMPLRTIGLLEGYTHQATLIYQTTQSNTNIKRLIDEIYELLATTNDIKFGISQSHYTGFVIRLLGSGGEQLYETLQKVQSHMWSLRYTLQ